MTKTLSLSLSLTSNPNPSPRPDQAGSWPQLCLRASSSLHDSAVAAVLRARLDFYFRTPLGLYLLRHLTLALTPSPNTKPNPDPTP